MTTLLAKLLLVGIVAIGSLAGCAPTEQIVEETPVVQEIVEEEVVEEEPEEERRPEKQQKIEEPEEVVIVEEPVIEEPVVEEIPAVETRNFADYFTADADTRKEISRTAYANNEGMLDTITESIDKTFELYDDIAAIEDPIYLTVDVTEYDCDLQLIVTVDGDVDMQMINNIMTILINQTLTCVYDDDSNPVCDFSNIVTQVQDNNDYTVFTFDHNGAQALNGLALEGALDSVDMRFYDLYTAY